MTGDAASLHCPNCGAPVDPDARRCPYCKARLATVSCPACFALMFEGTAFCPKCGARRSRSQQEAAGARCPGCRGAMQELRIGATSLVECGACDGIWLDADTFESLCASRDAQAAVLHQLAAKAEGPRMAVKYRPCARCGKMMNRVNFGRISGVVVDVCKGHGTYLDAGELHAIVQFIQAGGLDRARARQLEDLKEQERNIADAERRLARERGRADPRASVSRGTWSFMVDE